MLSDYTNCGYDICHFCHIEIDVFAFFRFSDLEFFYFTKMFLLSSPAPMIPFVVFKK